MVDFRRLPILSCVRLKQVFEMGHDCNRNRITDIECRWRSLC